VQEDGHIMFGHINYDKPHSEIEDVKVIEYSAIAEMQADLNYAQKDREKLHADCEIARKVVAEKDELLMEATKREQNLRSDWLEARAEIDKFRKHRSARRCGECGSVGMDSMGLELLDENLKLRSALEFYGNENNYWHDEKGFSTEDVEFSQDIMSLDLGVVARKALEWK
jgi:hypothetical protein